MIRLNKGAYHAPGLGLGLLSFTRGSGEEPGPGPGPEGFPALLLFGEGDFSYNGPNLEIRTYPLDPVNGLGEQVGDTYVFGDDDYVGATGFLGGQARAEDGILFFPVRRLSTTPISAGLIAFSVSEAGITKLPGEVALVGADEAVNVKAAPAGNGRAYVCAFFADGTYKVTAGEVVDGELEEIGTALSGDTTYPSLSSLGTASLLDGCLVVARQEAGRGANRYRLLAFKFDEGSWSLEDLELAENFSQWHDVGDYIVGDVNTGGTGRTLNYYRYTAADGFELAFSFVVNDPANVGIYTEPNGAVADAATGAIWYAVYDEEYTEAAMLTILPNNAGTGVDFSITAPIPGPHSSPTFVHGGLLGVPGESYENVEIYKYENGVVGDKLPDWQPINDWGFVISV